MIRLFEEHLLPHFPNREKIRIIYANAFDYAAHCAPHEGYDTVFTNLWHDAGDGLPLYRRMKSFEYPVPRFLYWIELTLRLYLPD